jgi:hypothetical protein
VVAVNRWTGRVAVVLALLVAPIGCADPRETRDRGVAELARHSGDPLLSLSVAGLRLVDQHQEGAYVDEGAMGFRAAYPTTFVRTFATDLVSSDAVFSGFDAVLRGRGATPAGITCRISVPPLEQHVYAGSSLGDDVRIAVTVRADAVPAQVTVEVAIAKAVPTRNRGLRDCLTRKLDAAAYLVPEVNSMRTDDELCRLLTVNVYRALFSGGDEKRVGKLCVVEGRRSGKKARIQIVEQRTRSVASLLDEALPDADPSARVIDVSSGGGDGAFLVVRLRSGAVRVDSGDREVAELLARLLLDGEPA